MRGVLVLALLVLTASHTGAETAPRHWTPPIPELQVGGDLQATADHLEADLATHRLQLTGNVALNSGQSQVHAERLDVALDGEGHQIERLEARGHVRLVYGPYTATASTALFDNAAGRVRLDGNAKVWGEGRELLGSIIELDLEARTLHVTEGSLFLPAERALEQLRISAATIFADDSTGRGRFKGDVQVTTGQRRLWAEVGEIVLDRESGGVRLVEASGGVRFEEGIRRGRADQVRYTPLDHRLLLAGGAELEEGDNRLQGDRIQVDLVTRQVTVSHGTIRYLPQRDLPLLGTRGGR